MLTLKGIGMDYAITKRLPCSVCGIDTFRRTGWFLVVENRWLDRLKILSWHSSLATQKDIKSVCCREHLKTLIAHWLSQANLRLPPARYPAMPLGSDPNLIDLDLGSNEVGRLVGELAVHRESFSRVWVGLGRCARMHSRRPDHDWNRKQTAEPGMPDLRSAP